MKVVIPYKVIFSFFSSGSPQTILSVGEVFKAAGHEVVLLNINENGEEAGEGKIWWEDVQELQSAWKVVKEESNADLLIEVGEYLLTPEQRSAIHAKKSVWLSRKPFLLNDIEHILYPFTNTKRDLSGVDEIWAFEENTTKDDIEYAELLLKKRVRTVPFIWTPMALESYRTKMQQPVWQQMYEMSKAEPWSVHICETNQSATSSSTLPLFIVREIVKRGEVSLAKHIKIHNADNVKNTEFFKQNVCAHAFSDISGVVEPEFIGRQRTHEWVYDKKSIVIAHSRFLNMRPYWFDLAWCGIPFLHNSKMLKERLGLADGYYEDNGIADAADAMKKVSSSVMEKVQDLIELRKRIISEVSPFAEKNVNLWNSVAEASVDRTLEQNMNQQDVKKADVTIGFYGMWIDFNAKYNFFLLMLRQHRPDLVIEGIDLAGDYEKKPSVDLVICGPWCQSADMVRSKCGNSTTVPLVFFTCENIKAMNGMDLSIGFDRHADIRLPLWILYLDWFGGTDNDRLQNPKMIPLSHATKTWSLAEAKEQKKKFCAFVVSNPTQPVRNAAFTTINNYKKVDSAGRLFNNMGGDIFAGPGGGGGELKKFKFFGDYKFCITYENSAAEGYTTEKFMHAKAAGCIPVYWGDPCKEGEFDFLMEGAIDARNCKSEDELLELVKAVDSDDAVWEKKLSVPLLSEEKVQKVRELMAQTSDRLLSLAKAASERISFDTTLFITATNEKFISSAKLWIQSLLQQKQVVEEIGLRVYLMSDVSPGTEDSLRHEFPLVEFCRLPTEPLSDNFTDIWAPEHFAWKIWILQDIVKRKEFKNRPVFYLDAGCIMVKWPRAWLDLVRQNGICVLEDPTVKLENWSHSVFKEKLNMTQAEGEKNDIWAGALSFIAGHEVPMKLFEEAWKLAQVKEIITGSKWIVGAQMGGVYGHRHDQSILSLLSQRYNIKRLPMYNFYCQVSLRHTYLSDACIYAHRGNFTVHKQPVKGIDSIWCINLDRRKDRWTTYIKTHKSINHETLRLPAFDGKKLKLTRALARMFMPNNFNWKKGVVGCTCSHIAIWLKLAMDKPDIQTYLVLEDDVRLKEGWEKEWEKIHAELPADWDICYLGGILPPNREVFDEYALEPISEHLGRIKPNTFFGQSEPSRFFPSCAYSYVLSRRGAMKILEVMKARGGAYTISDHLMDTIPEILNLYFARPLIAGCFQDDDPVYKNSKFDDFNREDTFDSDLWNNTDRFTDAEIAAVLNKDDPLDFITALEDARECMTGEIGEKVETKGEEKKGGKRRIINFSPNNYSLHDAKACYEKEWFEMIFADRSINLQIENVGPDYPIEKVDDQSIILMQRPYSELIHRILYRLKEAGKKFYILHISDEYGQDCIEAYDWPECLGVVRNYPFAHIKEQKKIFVMPLGFHYGGSGSGNGNGNGNGNGKRDIVWSFVGTKWHDRERKVRHLEKVEGKNYVKFMDDWNAPNMVGREEMLDIYARSIFVPCPRGQNVESFRFYEALEAGCIPICVKDESRADIQRWIPLILLDEWSHAPGFIQQLMAKPEILAAYQQRLQDAWKKMKKESKERVAEVFQI